MRTLPLLLLDIIARSLSEDKSENLRNKVKGQRPIWSNKSQRMQSEDFYLTKLVWGLQLYFLNLKILSEDKWAITIHKNYYYYDKTLFEVTWQYFEVTGLFDQIVLWHQRGTKLDAAVRHFEHFWQFYDLVQVLLCADRRFFENMQRSLSWKVPGWYSNPSSKPLRSTMSSLYYSAWMILTNDISNSYHMTRLCAAAQAARKKEATARRLLESLSLSYSQTQPLYLT